MCETYNTMWKIHRKLLLLLYSPLYALTIYTIIGIFAIFLLRVLDTILGFSPLIHFYFTFLFHFFFLFSHFTFMAVTWHPWHRVRCTKKLFTLSILHKYFFFNILNTVHSLAQLLLSSPPIRSFWNDRPVLGTRS